MRNRKINLVMNFWGWLTLPFFLVALLLVRRASKAYSIALFLNTLWLMAIAIMILIAPFLLLT